jgi:hypothetical protein
VRYWIAAQLSSLDGRQRPAPTLRGNTCQLGTEAGPQSAGFVEEQHSERARLPVVLGESDDAVDKDSREQHTGRAAPGGAGPGSAHEVHRGRSDLAEDCGHVLRDHEVAGVRHDGCV